MKLLNALAIQSVNPGAYSGYHWHSKTQSALLASFNPATEEKIAEVSLASLDDYQTIITQAERAFMDWRAIPAPKRGEIIRQIAVALREKKPQLAKLVAIEMGKSLQEGGGEVQEMIDIADFAVGQSRMLYGKTMPSERINHRMFEQWHPYGIVGIISAFNFPVAVWAWNAFIGAVCGNVMVWKPSSKTPLCAIAIQKICNSVLQHNQMPAIFSLIIPQSHAIIDAMLDDTRIPVVSFTGSTATGKKVSSRVAYRLGKSILELGGNNAVILDETADLKLAIPAIVFGAIGTAGQRCTSTRRLFIPKEQRKKIVKQLISAYQQISIGNPLTHLMGPLIDKSALVRFKQAIKQIKTAGGRIIYGGKTINQTGFFVEPTLIVDVENHWDIVQQETFAPILYIMTYESFSDAIRLQNSVPQGLSSALFTQKLHHAEQFLSALGSDCGIANINIGTSGAEIGGAFGGEKDTGGGREAGSDAWQGYMRRQTNTINWSHELPLAQGINFVFK